VLVESIETAVVDGMPQAVLRTGTPAMEEPLGRIAEKIVQFAHSSTNG
jgi:chemotaxis response regulator CheB